MKVIISNQSKIGNPSEVKVTNNNNVGRVTFGKVVRPAEVAIGLAVDLNKNGSVDGSVITYLANTDTYILRLPSQDGVNAYAQANAAYTQANLAYNAANVGSSLAYNQANAAYDAANTKLSSSGGTISGDLAITGNLVVSGNATQINVTNLNITDSILYLAANNETSDAVDIGFIGGKRTSGIYSHTGLIRHAADQKYYLFDNYLPEPENNVVNVSSTTLATLKANIEAQSITINNVAVATTTDVNLKVSKSGDTVTGKLTLTAANTALEVTNNVIIGASGSLGIGTSTPRANLEVTGNAIISQGLETSTLKANSANISGNIAAGKMISLNDIYQIYANTFQVATNSPVQVDKFSASAFGTVKYIIQMSSIEGIHSTEILGMQNGAETFATEYATLVSGPLLGYFNFYLFGTDVILEFEPDNPNNDIIDFRLIRYGLTN